MNRGGWRTPGSSPNRAPPKIPCPNARAAPGPRGIWAGMTTQSARCHGFTQRAPQRSRYSTFRVATRHAVMKARRRDEGVEQARSGMPVRFGRLEDRAPALGDARVDREQAPLESVRELGAQPALELGPARGGRQLRDRGLDLAQREHAQEEVVFGARVDPRHDGSCRARTWRARRSRWCRGASSRRSSAARRRASDRSRSRRARAAT